MKEANKNLIKLAVVCTALNDGGTAGASPALANIAAAFPHVSPFLIQSITTVPALLIAIAPPVYSKMLEFTSKRTWLWIGALCFALGGVGPAILNGSIWAILILRAIFGIGCGVLTTMSTDLCVDFFEGRERNAMMGYVSASIGVSSVMFSLLGGWLGGIKWNYCFFSYASALLFMGIAIAFLPEPDRKAKIEADIKANVNTKLTLGAYVHAMIFTLFYICFYVLADNAAMVLIGDKLAVPAQIGVVMALLSIVSFVLGVMFSSIFKVLKFYMLPLGYLCNAISLFICYNAHSLITFGAGVAVMGLALGFAVPTTMSKLSSLVSYTASAKAIALGYFGMGIGGFLSPIVFSLFGSKGVGRTPFLYGFIAMIVMAVIVLIANKAFPSSVKGESLGNENSSEREVEVAK